MRSFEIQDEAVVGNLGSAAAGRAVGRSFDEGAS